MPTLTHHLYSGVVLKSMFCNRCKRESFIIEGKLKCCGAWAEPWTKQILKLESCRARRKRPGAEKAREILSNQGNKCLYCLAEFGSYRTINGKFECVQLHWDHYIPFDFLETNQEFVAACSRCNAIKSDKIFGTLFALRKFILERLKFDKVVALQNA